MTAALAYLSRDYARSNDAIVEAIGSGDRNKSTENLKRPLAQEIPDPEPSHQDGESIAVRLKANLLMIPLVGATLDAYKIVA